MGAPGTLPLLCLFGRGRRALPGKYICKFLPGTAAAATGLGHVSGDQSLHGAEEPGSCGGGGQEVGGSAGGKPYFPCNVGDRTSWTRILNQ